MDKLLWVKVPEYLINIEEVAFGVLIKAREARDNPQAPDFIELDKLSRSQQLAISVLESVGFLRKTIETNDAYVITDDGRQAIYEFEECQDLEDVLSRTVRVVTR